MSERPRIELTTRPDMKDRRQLWGVLASLGTFGLMALILVRGSQPGMPWENAWDDIGSRILESPHFVFYFLVSISAGWAMTLVSRQYIVFDEHGIQYSTHAPSFLKFAQPDWSYSWSEIERVDNAHASIEYPAQAFVIVKAGGKHHRVQMLGWRRVEKTAPTFQTAPSVDSGWRLRMPELKLKSQKEVMADRLADSELLRAFETYRVPIGKKSPSFDRLAETKAGVTITVIGIGAMLYVMGEMLIGQETYATVAPWLWIAAVVVFGAMVGYLVADSLNLKLGEKIGLPILLAGAFGAASYPGIVRLNVLLDPNPAVTVNYQQGDDLRLHPESDLFPTLRIERYDWYWQKFEPGQVHKITIRRGGLGIWAYNAAALREQISQRDER